MTDAMRRSPIHGNDGSSVNLVTGLYFHQDNSFRDLFS
jgi:hypothetical protein